MAVRKQDEMALALLRAAGIPSDDVVYVKFEHHVNELPVITVGLQAWDADAKELIGIEQTWRCDDEPSTPTCPGCGCLVPANEEIKRCNVCGHDICDGCATENGWCQLCADIKEERER